MHGDWVVGVDSPCMLPIVINDDCQADPFTSPTTDFSLIDTTDITDKEDALTVVRVVGDMPMLSWLADTGSPGFHMIVVTVREGIYVSTVDPNGVAIDMDPRLPADMESDCWLYLRSRVFKFGWIGGTDGAGGTTKTMLWQSGGDYATQQNDHLDLRVKRKLKRGQELIYTVGAYFEELLGSGIDETFPKAALQPHLRCYVKY